MSINPITAMTSQPHVTSYDARKIVYALGGPWPHRCKVGNGTDNLQCTINEENSLYLDIAQGIAVFHGYVFSNDSIISREMTRAGSSDYRKTTVYLKAEISTSPGYAGYESLTLEIADSETASTASALSYPELAVPAYDDYIIDDATAPDCYYIPLAHVLIHGGAIEAVEDLLPLWDGKQFYAPGDEVNISYNIFSGYLAASGANVYFFVPLAKAFSMVNGVTLSGLFTIRHADGGFIGSNSGQTLESLGTVTASLYESGIYVRCVMNTPSSLTNQAPLSVLAASGAKLTFY